MAPSKQLDRRASERVAESLRRDPFLESHENIALDRNSIDVSSSRLQHDYYFPPDSADSNDLANRRYQYSQRIPSLGSSLVSTIQPTRSSQFANLHHRVGINVLSQNVDTIDLAIGGPLPTPIPAGLSIQKTKRKLDIEIDSRKLPDLGESDAERKNCFLQTSLMELETLENLSSNYSRNSSSSLSISSLGSSDTTDEPSSSTLVNHFKSIGSSRFPAHDSRGSNMPFRLLAMGSQTPLQDLCETKCYHQSLFSPVSTRKLSEWNREFEAQNMHQERRRVRQLVFFAASFLISIMFLFGIVTSNIERMQLESKVLREQNHPSVPIIEAPERDTLIIYRIIGNDLPPRHSPRQTLTNLKFMLEHESSFEDLPGLVDRRSSPDSSPLPSEDKLRVKKFFVLNRIANQTQLSVVENMLKSYGINVNQILIIPFVPDVYKSQKFDVLPDNYLNQGLYLLPKTKASNVIEPIKKVEARNSPRNIDVTTKILNLDRWKALDFTYHSKNLYTMNNNGGRNFALEHARSIPEARWILPMDGNCFFTPTALRSLVLSLRESDSHPNPPAHVILPMSRLINNQQALDQNNPTESDTWRRNYKYSDDELRPHTPHEPQIGFRFNSNEKYSIGMRYGRRSKLELLWRLGAIDRSRNLDKKMNEWELNEKNILTTQSYGSIRRKLRSPFPENHEIAGKHRFNSNQSHNERDFVRAGWVLRLFSGDRSQEEYSEKARSRRCNNRIKGIVSFLEGIDESIVKDSATCRTDNPNKPCGFADWRLWSLDGEELEKIKQLNTNKDPSAIQFVDHLVQLAEPVLKYASSIIHRGEKDLMKRIDLPTISNTVFMLALTAYLADEEQYAETAASLVDVVFLQPNYSLSTPGTFQVSLNTRLRALRLQTDYDGFGYGFPIPRHEQSLPRWMNDTKLEHLPFNPYTFDPTLLLDGIRLLSNDWKTPRSHKPRSRRHQRSLRDKIPKNKLDSVFTLQMSYLLLNDSMVQELFTQGATEQERLNYALKLCALASFTDDIKLLNRILHRTPIGASLSSSTDHQLPHGLLTSKDSVVSGSHVGALIKLNQRFRAGFHNRRIQTMAIPPHFINIDGHFESLRKTFALLTHD